MLSSEPSSRYKGADTLQKDSTMTKMRFRIAGLVRCAAGTIAVLALAGFSLRAQQHTPSPQTETQAVALTLRRAIELALQNSRDIQVAKLQASLANRSALITKSQFLPNLYAGSGAGYTLGIPETPGGRAPALFNLTYTQQVYNEPLRGQAKEMQEQAKSQR